MGSEASLWMTMRKTMRHWPKIKLTRVENSAESGHPDTTYVIDGECGVIELKHRHEWPKREATIVRLDHYTPEQKLWLYEHHRAGGRTFLMLQVERDYLLFRGDACQLVGQVPRGPLFGMAERIWEGRINFEELRAELTR